MISHQLLSLLLSSARHRRKKLARAFCKKRIAPPKLALRDHGATKSPSKKFAINTAARRRIRFTLVPVFQSLRCTIVFASHTQNIVSRKSFASTP